MSYTVTHISSSIPMFAIFEVIDIYNIKNKMFKQYITYL